MQCLRPLLVLRHFGIAATALHVGGAWLLKIELGLVELRSVVPSNVRIRACLN